MFRIPRSQLNRGRTLTTPTSSAASIPPPEADASSRTQPHVFGSVRPRPFFVPAASRLPMRSRSSPPTTPTSRPSTAAGGARVSSFDDDVDDVHRRGYDRRPADPHLTLDEGGGACVVVVAPGPMAAAAAAASRRQSRRRRPPTPVGGDGFPSVADELRTCTTTLSALPVDVVARTSRGAGRSSPSSSSSFSTMYDGDVAENAHRDQRTMSDATDDSSHDRRSVGSSRANNSGARAPMRLHHSKLGARLMLAVLGISSVVLLALLLAYNTQLEQDFIHRIKGVFDKSWVKRHTDINSTHDIDTSGSAVEEAAADPHHGRLTTAAPPSTSLPTLPESSEEFEQRLRDMVSRFWTPRGENDYAGGSGYGFDTPRTRARRRGWPENGGGRDVDDADGRATSPLPTEPLSQPLVRDSPHRRTDWFLVQARRSHGRLPDAIWDGDGKRGNSSREDTAEIEQLWVEGEDMEEDAGGTGYP